MNRSIIINKPTITNKKINRIINKVNSLKLQYTKIYSVLYNFENTFSFHNGEIQHSFDYCSDLSIRKYPNRRDDDKYIEYRETLFKKQLYNCFIIIGDN